MSVPLAKTPFRMFSSLFVSECDQTVLWTHLRAKDYVLLYDHLPSEIAGGHPTHRTPGLPPW
jgi:hypothetical protein